MEPDGASANSTKILESSLSPEERADQVREELEMLDVWTRIGADDELKSKILDAASKATADHLCPLKRSRRRLSVLDRTTVVTNKIRDSIEELNGLWDSVDMNEERRLARVSTAYHHMETLLSDMVASENAMITAIHEGILEYSVKVAAMREELAMEPFNLRHYAPKSIALWKALEDEMGSLQQKREKALQEQKEAIERFGHLCSRLGSDFSDETAASLPDTSVLARHETVVELRARCDRMERLVNERVEQMVEAQADINKWTRIMGCDYDENVAAVLEVDARAAESALTQSLIEQTAEIRQQMADRYAAWLSEAEFEYTEHLTRLAELWEMCCIGERERALPPRFDPKLLDSLAAARDEVARLERVYASRRDVYERMGVWRGHWAEKLAFESSESSLDKYKNRGGDLEQRLKHEKQLTHRLLPQAQQAVAEAYSAFLAAHPGGAERILIEGMEPLDFIRNVMSAHELERQMEKEQKAEARKAQLLQETKWGSTPGKQAMRRPLGPASSATRLGPAPKMPRVAEVHAAAAAGPSAAAAANFTFDQSAISAISPTTARADALFPKTSSPKGSRATVAPGHRFAAPSPAKVTGTMSAASTPRRPPLVPSNKK